MPPRETPGAPPAPAGAAELRQAVAGWEAPCGTSASVAWYPRRLRSTTLRTPRDRVAMAWGPVAETQAGTVSGGPGSSTTSVAERLGELLLERESARVRE